MGFKIIFFVPIIEIVLFILFGDLFGFFEVILIIFLSGFFGLWLLFPGSRIENIQKIGAEPIDWICKRVAGIFLIIPGFFTDILGIFLLIKSMRPLIWLLIPKGLKNFSSTFNKKYKGQDNYKRKEDDKIIDVEYKDLDD